jgi:glycosyltransferase involved in cell wall biosynthesis
VFVVPHRFAGGIPLKLAEAMSRGIPAVVSPLIAGQLGVTDGREVLVGRSPDEFAEKVMRVYGDAALWSRLRQNALTFVAETHDPGRLKAALNDIMSTDWRGRREAQKAPDAASNGEMAAGGDRGPTIESLRSP